MLGGVGGGSLFKREGVTIILHVPVILFTTTFDIKIICLTLTCVTFIFGFVP